MSSGMSYEEKYEFVEETVLAVEEERQNIRQRTKLFALRILKLFSSLPNTCEAQVLGKQVLRSGTSVGANYREAFRSRSKVEFLAKMGDCLKELDETAYWLELLTEANIIPLRLIAALQDECDELIAIFTTICKTTRQNLNKRTPHNS